MLWPLAKRRHLAPNPQLAQRVIEVRQQNPEAERWLELVEAAFGEAGTDMAWGDAVLTIATERPVRAPILHQAQIAVRRRPAQRWLRQVLELAAVDHGERAVPHEVEATALLEAAICQDDDRVDAVGMRTNVDPPTLRVIAQMFALPLLQTCGRALAGHLPAGSAWWEGYCPVCLARPTLAEFRGLERKRWLRCGRCGAGWEVPWLRCVFCDEANHENLGYLTPEEGEQSRRAEVCYTCKGYLKAQSTVRP